MTLFRPKKASLPSLSYIYSERAEGRTAEARKVQVTSCAYVCVGRMRR